MATKNIFDVLAHAGVLSLEEVSNVRSAAKKKGVSAEEMLYEKGISEEAVLQAKGEVFGLPVRKLSGVNAFQYLFPVIIICIRYSKGTRNKHLKKFLLGLKIIIEIFLLSHKTN